MRTAFLLLGTLVLLVGGFAVYLYVQGSGGKTDTSAATTQHVAQPVQDTDSTYTVRGGKDVWLKEFDESRRLTNQFRAAEFNPQKEGFVRVTKPEAHFFLRNGQWLRVTGETGDVIVPGMPEAGGKGPDPFAGGGAPAAAPTRGKLHNVHLQLYDTLASTQPTLDMEMNNAAFDNELFRIVTEAYTDETGKQIAADQVKVTVRGKYEFDGRGLMIRWNDLDRRLELLEIAHGERLVVKEPGELGAGMPGGKASADPAPMPAPIALASADPAAAAGAAAAARSDPKSTLYSIFFFDNVQVTQAEKTLATGDVIEVFYATRDEPTKPGTQPAAKQAPAPAPAPAPAEPASTPPTTSAPATAPATTQAAPQEPIVIYWTGKLRIVPCTTEPPAKLAPGNSAVQMRGLPVVLTRDNVQIRCPGFTYRTADGGVTLENSDAFPQVELKQFATVKLEGKPQVTLHSERVDYAPEAGVATLAGKSRAVFPADENDPNAEPATATWTRQGVARFTGKGNDSIMKALELQGDVDVQHPQLSLKSQRLNLAFDPPAPDPAKPDAKPQPVLRHVIADDAVKCVLVDEQGGPRELHGDHLDIETAMDAAGKMYPKIVNARGNVRAFEEGQELTSQELALLLAPAPPKKTDARPKPADKAPPKSTTTAVQLERMTAKTNVRAVSGNGDVATGDTLVVTTGPDGKPQIGLAGKPAKVTNAQGTVLTSTKIIIPNNDEAQALGPGTLHAVVEDKEAQGPPRHMDVSWTGSAVANMKLKENHVQIVGQVKSRMPEANGTMNTASADRMLITLVDKPPDPAKPATKPAKGKPAKNGGTLATSDVDVMKSKQVSRILLNKDAVVNSRLTAADGSVLREVQIDSSLLSYSVPTKRMVVPRPGRMLVRDHRPPEEKRVDANGEQQGDGLGSQRGATAFQWAESLNYDGIEQRATMKGDVNVAYKPDADGELPVRLRADEVVALFEDAPPPPPEADARGEAVKAAGEMKASPVRLRTVRAEGRVVVVRGGEELTAPRITYDPLSHWIRAVGTDDVAAVFSNGRGNSTTGREFEWNTKTWKVKVTGAAGRASGAGR